MYVVKIKHRNVALTICHWLLLLRGKGYIAGQGTRQISAGICGGLFALKYLRK